MLACKAIYVGGSGSGSNLIVHMFVYIKAEHVRLWTKYVIRLKKT